MADKKVLITGGAGFIGRWLVKRYLDGGYEVGVLDDLSNGSKKNLEEFTGKKGFAGLIIGDVRDRPRVHEAMDHRPDIVVHAAAQINVQSSLDEPQKNFDINILGTHNVLEEARVLFQSNKAKGPRVVMIGTCMVYEMASGKAISEVHPVRPASPYAASKLAGEFLAESYFRGFGLPIVVLRPFNTFGPFQKSNMEGGVVSIFVKRDLEGKDLNIFGDGKQTRDLLFVEDCADFIYKASRDDKVLGQVFNAGTGKDISVNELAKKIATDPKRIKHVPHIHPQSEIPKLLCDPSKAMKVLKWKPKVTLAEGIERLRTWFKQED
jgi:nucleoside-diphosphate-sugar epimerase